jgi:insecticidal toxin complex protein TccC
MSVDHAHHGTPTLAVSDSRGLAVRAIQYHRRQATDPAKARVTHQRFDAAGRPVASRDPYLFALAQNDASVPANLSQVFSLSGVPLASDSVDAGWRVALQGAAGQIVERWDGRGSHTLTEFDALLRPVAVRERGDDSAEQVLERFTYAGVDADTAEHNLCGQLIRHDDPAGTLHLKELGIGGAVLQQVRHFLRDADTPDWPASEAARDALLETGNGATTSHLYSPVAEPLQQTDALGNRQHFAYTVAGELKNTRLTLVGEDEMTLVSDLHYNASGQIESETAGNRVITRHRYDLADGRLMGLSAHKADGTPLQDLRYSYDATGNVLSLEDAAQPIRYFNNQRIEPLKTFRYDTLDQLIEASGWEAKIGHGGTALPDLHPLPLDPSQIANYTQTYHYDAGGNLLNLVHVGAQPHGRLLTRAKYSNRCLPERNGRPPTEAEIAAGFDANGNLRELQAGQAMEWDLRNQLTVVRPVVREEAEDDYERYVYDGGGQRVRKLRANQTNARTLISEVRYLPGVEIRSHGGTGEVLHVITASAGSNSVQVLHWVAGQPEDIANNQVRYSLNDHLQSGALELDQNAGLISQEWYYPFGGTACFAARSATEAKYKTVRYSGKERDATGLYYYGFRYYASWLQRWLNADPIGTLDGFNLYRMCKNNPATLYDHDGRITKKNHWLDTYQANIRKITTNAINNDSQEIISEKKLTDHITLEPSNSDSLQPEPPNSTPTTENTIPNRYLFNQGSKPVDLNVMKEQVHNGNIYSFLINNTNAKNTIKTIIKNHKNRPQSEYIFALSEKKGMRILARGDIRNGFKESAFHHQNIFIGRTDILSAGTIYIHKNKAIFTNYSGHYKPSKDSLEHIQDFFENSDMNKKHFFINDYLTITSFLAERKKLHNRLLQLFK